MISAYLKDALDENGKKCSYYVVYTVLFLIVSFFCFSWFVFSGRSMIWQEDGWDQFYKAFFYYGQYLRDIVKHLLFERKLVIPEWDFYIAEGNDILTAMHYYVMGDPVSLLAIFIPSKLMPYGFSVLNVFRIYLAGISFSALCFGTGRKNRYAIMAGSLSHSFCAFALFTVARAMFFINPLIYFPLMILGIEKIIQKKRPYIFILATAVSAASNFYFFYMIVLLTVVYTFARLILLYRSDIKKTIASLINIGFMSVVGVGISGIIFLPVFMIFFGDSRNSVQQSMDLFYPLSYYSKLPSIFITIENDYWLYIGLSFPVILALFVLFIKRKKEDLLYRVLFIICMIFILFPVFGRILNGMSYVSNRWCWAVVTICSYILVVKWEDILTLSKRECTILAWCCLVYFIICNLLKESRGWGTNTAMACIFITLLFIREDAVIGSLVKRQIALVVLSVMGVVSVAYFEYAPDTKNYVSEMKEYSKIPDEWNMNEVPFVKSIAGNNYTRFSGRNLTLNANIFSELSSTQYYWSISNPYVNKFRSELEMREELFYKYQNYDDRTTPTGLAGVEYYIVKDQDDNHLPFGFVPEKKFDMNGTLNERSVDLLKRELGVGELSDKQLNSLVKNNQCSVYRNEYALPLAYCYDKYVSKEQWDSYDPVQKQEVQLEAAFVDKAPEELGRFDEKLPDYSIPYKLECDGNEIAQKDNCIVTTDNNKRVVISFDQAKKGSETYIRIKGLQCDLTKPYDLYGTDESIDLYNLYNKTNWDLLSRNEQIKMRDEKLYGSDIKKVYITFISSDKKEKKLVYRDPKAPFSSGRHDYIVNMGYTEEPISSIDVIFEDEGKYSFDSIEVYNVPMDRYVDEINRLKENTLKDINIGTNCVTGNISLNETKLLCLATSFSKGWEAYVDEDKTEVYCVNDRYTGISVPPGQHRIKFIYRTPYKKAGIMISILGIAALLILLTADLIKNRKRRGN